MAEVASPSAVRRWRRRFGIGALVVLACILVLLVAVRWMAATSLGHSIAEQRLEALRISGQTIALDGIDGDLLGEFTVDRIELSDASGIWLSARDVTVAWAPSSLFARRLNIERVSAAAVDLRRRPMLVRSAAGDGDTGPLRRYSLGALNVRLLTISETLASGPSTYRLSAHLDTDIKTGEVDIDLRPEEASGDQVLGHLAWGGVPFLQGELAATGPEDGLLYRLLRLTSRAGVDIRVTGSGLPEDWRITASATTGEASILSLEASGTGVSGAVSGVVDPRLIKPLSALAGRLGGPAQIDARIEEASAGGQVLRGSLVAPNLRADASAPFDAETREIDLTRISVTATSTAPNDLAQVRALSASRLQAGGMLAREEGSWRFSGQASALDVSLAGFEAGAAAGPITLDYTPDTNSLAIDARVRTKDFAPPSDALSPYLGTSPTLTADVQIDLAAKAVSVATGTVEALAGRATANGRVSFDASEMAFLGRVELSEGIGDVNLSGGRWSLARTSGGAFRFGADGNVSSQAVADLLGEAFAGDGTLSLRGSLEPAGTIDVTTVSLEGPRYRLEGRGRYMNGALEADASARVREWTTGSVSARAFEITAAARGPLDALSIEALARPDSLVVEGGQLEITGAEFTGNLDSKALSGAARLEGVLAGNGFELRARPALEGDSWAVRGVTGRIDQLDVSGDFRGQGAALADLEGALDLDGSLQFGAERVALDGSVTLEAETFAADVRVGEATWKTLAIDEAHLIASGARQGASGKVKLIGAFLAGGEPRRMDLSAPISVDLAAGTLQLSPAGMLAGFPLAATEPVRLSLSDAARELSGKLTWLGGAIIFDARQAGDELTAEVRAANVSLPDVGKLFGRPGLRGTAGFEARLSGRAGDLSGKADLSIRDLSSGPPDTPKANIEISGDLANGVLALTGDAVDLDDDLKVKLTGRVPLRTSAAPFALSAQPGASADFDVRGGGQVESLWNLFGLPDSRFEGLFTVDANVSGPLERLRPNGTFTLTEAVYEDGLVGLHLKDIGLRADLDHTAINVTEMSASGAKGGALSGSGRYAFDGSAEVAIQVNRLNALQRDDVSATLSGSLGVARENAATKISGVLGIDRADVDITKLPSGGYATLYVVFPDRLSANGADELAEEAITLDIALKSDRRIFVEGNGLTSEWGIDAAVSGPASSPQLFGEAFIVRGDVDFAGRSFRFAESGVFFNGDPAGARLDIRAERTAGDLTAGINVSGTAQAPEFALISDPALPEDEILSRVLFGRSPAQLSALEAAQLASGIASLSGSGGLNIVGSLQDALGVDRLDLGITEEGEASIGAGKYLAEDIYVEVRTTARGAPGVSVEWTPEDNLAVGTELDPEAAPRLSIKWKRDYGDGDDRTQNALPELSQDDREASAE